MYIMAIALLISSSITTYADSCPRLQGTFRCRSAEPFDLTVKEEVQNGTTVYILTDQTGVRTFATDGQFHEMGFRSGKGEYKAQCEGNSLLLEAHSAAGEVVVDRYYIERAALVRVRLNKTSQAASSLSCAPTQGTWKLYPH